MDRATFVTACMASRAREEQQRPRGWPAVADAAFHPLHWVRSMTELEVGVVRFATTLESHRKQILQEASMAICSPGVLPLTEQFDAVPRLSALLTASLEELRMAAAEIEQQEATLAVTRADGMRELAYYRALFVLSPIPSLVSDRNSVIHEVNPAMSALLKYSPGSLDRTPLATLVPRAERQEFRLGLTRLELTNGTSDWMLTLERRGDAPITVGASVTLLPDHGSGVGTLLWHFHPRDDRSAH